MKKIFPLLLLAMAALAPAPASAADSDWRKAAREFMAAQDFPPIETKPTSPTWTDFESKRWAWTQRSLLPVFEKHLAKWPAQAEAMRKFVKQALMAKAGHPEVDPARPWDVMAREGATLIKARVDEPLVLWLSAWTVWESHEGYTEARDYLSRALRHKMLGDYPSTLIIAINSLMDETARNRKSQEAIAKSRLEHYQQIMKSALNPDAYTPEEDLLLLEDVEFIFDSTNVKTRLPELEQFCETAHFTPWLREMLHGKLQNQIAWTYRGTGYANTVKEEGWKQFAEHQVQARTHYLKAWELHPDRAAAASAMIDIVKCGNGQPEDTLRLWFDRAISADPEYYSAYYNYLWALRPRWSGSVDKMKAFYCACTLTGRVDSTMMKIMRRILDYIEEDADDLRATLSQSPMKEAVVESCRQAAESTYVYRLWQHPWRLGDLGVMAWLVGDYETAFETFQKVPVPFPRQTRRRLNLRANEVEVRGQSALHAFGLNQEWDAAEELYTLRKITDALQSYQDIASRFQDEPPLMLLERIAACKFESAFATGDWVAVTALPGLNEWHHLSGSWTGQEDGTLVNTGHDAQAFILHNGRTGSSFELMGEYEVKDTDTRAQGIGVMLGYHSQARSEDWISCSQWSATGPLAKASMLRKYYQTTAPHVMPPLDGQTWKFHILCRNGAITYRLNHRDIVVDYRVAYKDEEPFEMPEDSVFGFFNQFFKTGSHTHIRRLKIRRLEAPEIGTEESAPASLAALRAGFKARCQSALTTLNADALTEAETQADELQREHKDAEAAKLRDFATRLKSPAAVKLEDMPVPVTGETTLSTFMRGYHASVSDRLRNARAEWKAHALEVRDNTENTQEAADVTLYINAELEEPQTDQTEDPLAAPNRLKWQSLAGEWNRTTEVLTGSGDSTLLYDFTRKPPFQIDFDINVLDGKRPRLVLGNVKFANEGGKNTFGLYPQPKGAKLFDYALNKLYHITLKALPDKTELHIDGTKICDGPKIEEDIGVLQFRGGDWSSKGKTEFRKIRISPLP